MARRLLLAGLLTFVATAPLACEKAPPVTPDWDGGAFFTSARVTRILKVELADREALLLEYVGTRIAALVRITGATKLADNAPGHSLGDYVVHGVAAVHPMVDVQYTVHYEMSDVLTHKIDELAEVRGEVSQASWETRGQRQALRVIVQGDGFVRLDR